jgi:hypothetical protein
MTKFALIIGLVIAPFVLGTFVERGRMRHYWQRACTGRLWRQRFPAASKSEIRQFLDVFIESFGFADRRRLCFAPDDRVMDVYRAVYPHRFLADGMELETLVRDLQRRYRVEIHGSWRDDITLGDLFRHTRPDIA